MLWQYNSITQFSSRMNKGSFCRDISDCNATVRLNHAIQTYKHTYQCKATLQNKINILKQQCLANNKKAELIRTNIAKINDIKNTYRQEKKQIRQILKREKENIHSKLVMEKERRVFEKMRIETIKSQIVEERKQGYRKIKEVEKLNQEKITQNYSKEIHEKRQKSLEVRLQEEKSKLTKTIFFQCKRFNTQRNSKNEIEPLQNKILVHEKHIGQMRALQSEMMYQLNNSRTLLSRSKTSLRNAI